MLAKHFVQFCDGRLGTADPSTPLRSAQDDSAFGVRRMRAGSASLSVFGLLGSDVGFANHKCKRRSFLRCRGLRMTAHWRLGNEPRTAVVSSGGQTGTYSVAFARNEGKRQ